LWVRSWMFQVVKSVISGFFDGFASGTGRGRTSCAGRESMREPRAMPRLKVPAPQANRVAARPCPPRSRAREWWPEATRPSILGTLAANVTYCKTRHLHNVFLKGEALGWRRLEKACPLACQARRARSDAPYHPWVGEVLDDCGCVHGCLKL
jgi:hypothetical protein